MRVSRSLGQMKKQEKALQEEVKRLTEELAEALRLIKELQGESGRNLVHTENCVCVFWPRPFTHMPCVCFPLLTKP